MAAALAADPAAATRAVGLRTPILHLAFSRHIHAAPDKRDDMLAIADLLVAAGADVNDAWTTGLASGFRLSALYGALGHADNMALAEWLLEHGADPDDGESLYHATELGHHEGLKLLIRHGVRPAGTNALARMLDFDDIDGVRLLLDHGADPNERVPEHPSGEGLPSIPALHQAARRGRDGRFADLLLERGGDPLARWQGHTPYALARIYGNASFAAALAARGHATPLGPGRGAARRLRRRRAAPAGRRLADLDPGPEARRILTRVIAHARPAGAGEGAGRGRRGPELDRRDGPDAAAPRALGGAAGAGRLAADPQAGPHPPQRLRRRRGGHAGARLGELPAPGARPPRLPAAAAQRAGAARPAARRHGGRSGDRGLLAGMVAGNVRGWTTTQAGPVTAASFRT